MTTATVTRKNLAEVIDRHRDDADRYDGQALGAGTADDPVFGWIEVQLTGNDGNAFSIMGQIQRALQRAGLREEGEAYVKDAQESESYDDLLQHAMKTVDVS